MGRKQSRRITLKKKHRIEKKVADHNRKLRKISKGMKKKARKDPGIPNSLPFKEEILREVALKKQQVKEEEERKKEAKKVERLEAKQNAPKNLEELRNDAETRTKEHTAIKQVERDEEPSENLCYGGAATRKYYFKEFKKVVVAADVIFEVLDARDPLSCRCPEVEQEVVNAGKKLVLLINKIDLVPKQNVVEWLKYLRREFPTLPFKASTQKQRRDLGNFKVKLKKSSSGNLGNSRSFGVDLIKKLLGNYSRNNDIKTAITIGIIGLPNVGKSSVINSLVRNKCCNIGDMPGLTKSMQEVHLDSKIKLLDSPGIVMQKDVDEKSLILRSCVPLQSVKSCVPVVDYMIKKMRGTDLNVRYKVGPFDSTVEFLNSICRRRGMLRKGGVACLEKAARRVLYDWHKGGISYYTNPPKMGDLSQDMETDGGEPSAEIVSKFSQEFDIDALMAEADQQVAERDKSLSSGRFFMHVESEDRVKCVNDALLEQETVIEVKGPFTQKSTQENNTEKKKVRLDVPVKQKEKVIAGENGDSDEDNDSDGFDAAYDDADEEGEVQFKKLECTEEQMLTYNKQMKMHLKKMKRKKIKTARLDSDLAEKTKRTMDIDKDEGQENQQPQKYDFTEHFAML